MDIKPKTVKWEVSNFSPGRTFDTVRCIKDKLRSILSENINRRSIISSRTGIAYKYTRTEGSKLFNTYILQIQKGSNSPCAKGQSSSICLFGKNVRDKKSTHNSRGKGKWEFCLAIQIIVTAEYLPGTLNTRADKVSREMKNLSSKWILNKPIIQKNALRPVDEDLLASRLCYQIPKYIRW